jgi:AraC-like DNA-binding protein
MRADRRDRTPDRSELAGRIIFAIQLNRNRACRDPCLMGHSVGIQRNAAAAVRFSTDDLPPRDRLPVWRELVFQSSMGVDVELESDLPFRADARICQLPDLRIMSGHTPPATYQRRTRTTGVDELTLQFGVSRGSFAHLNGRDCEIGSGEAYVLPCGDRVAIRVFHDEQFASLRFPRTALAGSVVNLSRTYCRPIASATPALLMLKRYIRMLEDDKGALASPGLQHAAVTHVYDLIALALGATRDAAEIANGRGVRAARLKAMKDDIVRQMKDQSLSVRTIAGRHNVTPRYVQKLFEESGETFTEFLVAQRLTRANRLLSDPQLADRTMTAIAMEAGFGDLSYFKRAFRRRYGGLPADLRASASAGR